MPRRIVFVNQATGYLTIDIINAFSSQFDEVAVIYGDLRVQDVGLDPKVKKSRVVEKSRSSNFSRFFRWSVASLQIFYLLLTRYRKYEIFYFSVPPFGYLSSLFIKRKFSVLMWDIYPDVLKNIGVKETSLIYRIWAGINRKLFKKAFRIYTIGDIQAEILGEYVNREKIVVIPLWSGLRECRPVSKDQNPFIKSNRLEGMFVVQYSGNMGLTCNIEILLEAAKKTLDEADILFQFIGRGTKWSKIKNQTEESNLRNCTVLPFQPDDLLFCSLSAADLSVVLVDRNASSMVIPSKVYNILAAGTPILSVSPFGSEIERLVRKYDVGKNFEDHDVEQIVKFIKMMKNSPEKLEYYKKNAIAASRDFSPANALMFYNDYCDEV